MKDKLNKLNKNELSKINNVLHNQNKLDIKHLGSRWIDQKCTPDVIRAVAYILYECFYDHKKKIKFHMSRFSNKQVRCSYYSRRYFIYILGKQDPLDKSTENDYNKFYSQSLNVFTCAGLIKHSHRHFKILHINLLGFIAANEENAYMFLYLYITQILKNSNVLDDFKKFFKNETSHTLSTLKTNFNREYSNEANRKSSSSTESNRICNKVINILALHIHKPGEHRGKSIDKSKESIKSLEYTSRINSRDKHKRRNESRRESKNRTKNKKTTNAKSEKAKRDVKEFNKKYNNSKSELKDIYSYTGNKLDKADDMHHIFPKSKYPSISYYHENIIAITSLQHFSKAHPNNDTQSISPAYQEKLLEAKLKTIKSTVNNKNKDQIYSYKRFNHVLNVGFGNQKKFKRYTFKNLMKRIKCHYKNILNKSNK